VLTIEQLEANRRKTLKDAEKSAADQVARDAKNTNLAKFLENKRVYTLTKLVSYLSVNNHSRSHVSYINLSSE
jgi:hypothetical protein